MNNPCLSRSRRWANGFSLLALLMIVATTLALPVLAAGGPGDGTTSSSWMSDKRMLQALGAISAEDYPTAIKTLNALVADKPKFANAWNYLGFSLRKMGKFARSEKAYLTALRLKPEHRGAHEYLAELYLQTDRRKQAEELERSLKSICRYGCPELQQLRAALKAR